MKRIASTLRPPPRSLPARGREAGDAVNRLLRRSRLHRQVLPRAPFGPRAVVDRLDRAPGHFEGDAEDRRRDAGAAGGDHRLVRIDACFREGLLEPGLVLQPSVLDDVAEGQVEASRNMAGTQARAWLGASPRKRSAGRASTTWAARVAAPPGPPRHPRPRPDRRWA